jgi:hypothetical protein
LPIIFSKSMHLPILKISCIVRSITVSQSSLSINFVSSILMLYLALIIYPVSELYFHVQCTLEKIFFLYQMRFIIKHNNPLLSISDQLKRLIQFRKSMSPLSNKLDVLLSKVEYSFS